MAVEREYIDALNDCIDRLNQGESIESILQDYPDLASELRPMLGAGFLTNKVRFPASDVQTAQDSIELVVEQAVRETFGSGLWGGWFSILVIVILAGGGILLGSTLLTTPPIPVATPSPTPTVTPTSTLSPTSTSSQIPPTPTVASSIQLEGIVTDIEAGVLIINNLSIDTTRIVDIDTINIGDYVTISGILSDGRVIASGVELRQTPKPPTNTPSPISEPMLLPSATVTVMPSIAPTIPSTTVPDTVTIIEGSVSNIRDNVITIYNQEIQIPEDDRRLNLIQLGDVLRVEVLVDEIWTAQAITFVNVLVLVSEGQAWRGDDCGNPPPDWASDDAGIWFVNCAQPNVSGSEGGNNNPPANNNNRQNNSNNDDDDDDDDDDD